MVMYLKNQGGYKMNYFKGLKYEDIRPIFEKVWDQIQSFTPMDSEKEKDGEKKGSRKKSLARKRVEEFAMEIESLATKYPIVDWKTHVLTENFMYYQIFKADGSSKNYKIFSKMLDDFDRQGVLDLHRLVKARYMTSSPEGYDLMLWRDLKIIFEPDEEDEVWRNQHEYNLISRRLFDSCGIHILLMNNGIAIYMMIEKKYPLTQEMLSKMLSRKLEVDHENEMEFKLLRSKKKQAMVFKVDFEKPYDSIRRDYLDDVLKKFLFGDRWRESLHLSFQNVVNEGMFEGVSTGLSMQLSHLFYVDDVVFMRQWSDSNIPVDDVKVSQAAQSIGCLTFTTPFSYLDVKVGGMMSRINSWDDMVTKLLARLLKWKMKTLSIRGRTDDKEKKITWHLKSEGIDLIDFVKKKIGNVENSLFWKEVWKGDVTFKSLYPRVYALETSKNITVAHKLAHDNMGFSLRRNPRGGMESSSSGEFYVASVRRFIDDHILPEVALFEEWMAWMSIIHYHGTRKEVLEGVFYIIWWIIWKF
ncbi:hypothetical protein Tco_0513251 [Tanacetum coccineum]